MSYEIQNQIVVGTQWGDEGKGKVVNTANTDAYARGQGGLNAGHTCVGEDGDEINTHLLPTGISLPGKFNIIGHGTYVDPVGLVEEIEQMKAGGYPVTPENLVLSSMAHVVSPRHIMLDKLREDSAVRQGSTKRGIAFVAADKYQRTGKRIISFINESPEDLYGWAYESMRDPIDITMKDLNKLISPFTRREADTQARQFVKAAKKLKPFIAHTPSLVQDWVAAGKSITGEGAQAFGLDIDYGNYPNATSSGTLVMSVAVGIGLNHKQIGEAVGVAKAIQSKVGGGNMVTAEGDPRVIDILRGKRGEIDAEFGKSTGRPRNVGYLDLVLLKAAAQANGLDKIVLNKVDTLHKMSQVGELEGCDGRLRAAIAYELDGKIITSIPEDLKDFERCRPVYEYFDSPEQSMYGETDYSKLPKTIRSYVEFCENYVGVPFAILGTGPANHHAVVR